MTIGDVLNTLEDNVFFSCGYRHHTVKCSFFVPDAITAKKIAVILKEHKGENLLSTRAVRCRCRTVLNSWNFNKRPCYCT